ncbi:MAG TPA: phospholipid carrier-dependent glycosyltransferase [Vicinamibacteria bacterium]
MQGTSVHTMPRRAWLLAGAISLLALALRLWGNGFGLPYTTEPDEPKLVHHALAIGLGDPNPHYFVYPALQMYLLFLCYGGLFLALLAQGAVQSVEDYKLLFLSDPTVFYQVGRALTAVFGAATVALMPLAGLRLYGSLSAGMLAALALAVHPIHVPQSHLVTADVPVTFFLLGGLVLAARLRDRPGAREGILAGAAAGLATAIKYSGLILLAPIAAALLGPLRRRPFPWRTALCVVAALAGAFALLSPYSLVEWRQTLDGMRFISDVKRDGQFGVARGPSWGTYFRQSFLAGPLTLATLAGVVLAAMRRTPADVLLLSFAVPYFLLVGASQSHSPRYLVPLLPVYVLLAARLAVAAWRRPAWRPVTAAAAAAALLVALAATVVRLRDLTLPDTRQAAREWIESRVPDGSTVALEWGWDDTVRLPESAESLDEKIRRYEAAAARPDAAVLGALRLLRRQPSDGPRYRVVRIGENVGNVLRKRRQDTDELRRLGVEYVVTSTAALGDPAGAAFRRAYPEIAAFYERLPREAELLRRFEASAGALRGPTISIFRLSDRKPAPAGVGTGSAGQ